MDLAITDFVKRSAEIAFGATKGSLKDYGKNVGELVTASKDIKDKLMPEVKNAKQAFSSMKRSGPISSISNWFYSKEYEIGDGDDMLNDTDEFDSGNPNLNDDDSSDSSSTVLDAGTAKGLARSQVSAMYRIGSKQTEASVANTAEIISNMSQRSADMIAAINNVNSTLINISNKMDNLITLLSPQQGVQEVNHSSIYDSSGRLSLSSISAALGNRASSTFGSSKDMLSMIKRAFTPEEVFRMTVVDRVFNKNLNALGGRSVDEVGKAFNKASGDAIQSILNTALQNTPLGDFLLKANRKSFADVSSQNQYTKDAAVFDKATRHTIVSIIPEYLKKITEAVTGQKWNIDERGTVTTKTVANPFKQAGAAILGASINYNSMNRLNTTIEQYSNQAISTQDQSAAVNALLIVYILQEKYNHPRQIIDASQVNNTFMTSPNRPQYTEMAVNIFVQNSMISDKNKAREIINTVWTYLATDKELARSFAQAVNSNYDKMYQAGKTIDANNPLAHQYANDSSISYDDMLNLVKSANVKGILQYDYDYNAEYERLRKQYGGRSTISDMRIKNKLAEWDRENRSKYLKNEEEEVTSRIGQANVSGKTDNSFFAQQNKLFASLSKYARGIYDILNSGVVNVRMVGQPVRRAVRNHREVRVRSSFGSGESSSDDGGGADEPPQPSTDTPQPLPILPTAGYTGEMSASERAFNTAMGYGSQATTTVRNFLSGGPVGMIRDEVSNIGTDIHAVGNRAIQLKSNQLHLDSMQRNIAGSDNISERDKMKFQAINTAINTAMQDGSGSEDKGKIRSMIQEIEDPELRRDLEKTSTALLTAHDEKVQPTSKLGKLLSMAKPVLSFVLSPIKKVLGLMLTGLKKYWSWTKKMWASGASDIVRGGRQIRQGLFGNREYEDRYGITHGASKGAIRSIGGGLIGLNRGIINGMPDGLTLTGDAMNLAGGIRNAGSSFIAGVRGNQYSDAPSSLPQRGDYGSRQEFNDAMRDYRRDSISSTFGNLGDKLRNSKFANKLSEDVASISESKAAKEFKKVISDIASGLKKFGSAIAKTASFIVSLPGKLAKGAEWLGGKANQFTSWVGRGVQKVEDRIANSAVGNAVTQSATFQGAKALVGNVISAPGRALAGTGQFLSGVGAGFRESMAEARRDKQQAKLKAQGPQTIADQETESINKKLETGEGKFFTSVLDLLTNISTNTEKAVASEESSGGNKQTTENNAGGDGQEIHTVDIPSEPTNSLGGRMSETAPASYGNSQTDAAGPSAEGGDKGGAKGAGKGIGKMLGGIMNVLGGIMKIVGPVLMAMEGIQMIQKLVQETLTKVLKPLDKIFKKLFKVLSPILDTLSKSLEPLMDCIVTVLDGIITPLAPVIQGIFEAVSPLLEIVAGLVEVIMVPLMAVFDKVLVPIIKQIGSAVKVIMGVVQMGFGALMVPLGGIMALIGKLPLVGGKGIGSKGKEIAQMGKDMIKGGAQMAVEGVKEFVAATLERLTLGAVGGDTDEKEEEKPSNVYQSKDASSYDPGAMEGLLGSGDSSIINNYYQNTYGSGNTTYNQHSYSSSGLNMHDHGCGPIALADRVNRTLGGRVDPNALAKSMAASGNYSSTRGTSIAGMLNTGRALGMNMQVGGVTPHSLSQATPNNPITVIGSGIGYDTRDGNNHFMNVLGTNGSGMAYVSNPMTGRVSRTPLNQLALHSKLGLYGSGDIEDNFNFGEEAKNAFSELKNLWTGITNIFNFESGETQADKMRKQKEELDHESYIATVKAHHSTAEWDSAYQEWIAENPQEDGEKDNDYKKRAEYAVAQKLAEKYKSGINVDELTGTFNSFKEGLVTYADNEVNDDPIGGTSGDGTFTSPDGKAVLALSDPTITDVDMKATDEEGLYTHAPILEFFARAAGHKAYVGPNNWYNQYGTAVNHDKNGRGTSGSSHEGVDIHWVGESTSIPIVAPTDGTFHAAIDEAHGAGAGNYVEFIDASGMHHRFLHMSSFSDEVKRMKQGDPIVGGETVLGYEGYTGHVEPAGPGGIHLHYDVSTNGYGSNVLNPLTYWKYNPITAAASLKDYENSAFMQQSNSVFRPSNADVNKKFFEAAKQAGLTTEQTAGIMAASIIENPDNVYGSRSLTATAYDSDGSGARKGLFSWAAGDAVGSTLADQLKYIYGYLYDPKTTDFRAYVRNYDFNPSTKWSGNTENTTYLDKYIASTGKQPHLKNGERYGSYATTDPIEGAAQLEMNAVVPTGLTTSLMNTLLRSTADAYNWATSNGFGAAKADPSSGAPKEWKANSPGDAKILANIRNAGTSSGENTGIVNVQDGSYLNLREGPNTNSAVLAEIPAGTSLKYMYDGNNGWLKLIDPYNGKIGYISADYVAHDTQEDGAAVGNVANSAMSGSRFDWASTNTGPAIYGPVTLEDATKSSSSNVYGPQLPANWNNRKQNYRLYWWNPESYKDLPKSILNSPNAVTELLKSNADILSKKNWDAMNFVELRNLGTRFDKEKYPTAWFKDLDYVPWVQPWGDDKQSNYMDPDNVWNRYIKEYQNGGPYADRFTSNIGQLKKYAKKYAPNLIESSKVLSLPASGDASIMDIPPIDYTDLGFGNPEQYSAQAIPTQYVEINKYNSPTDDQIDRLLAHEFKVSDEKNAEILNKIYAILLELNGGKEPPPTSDGGIPIDQMFNNEIPESIYRLSRG